MSSRTNVCRVRANFVTLARSKTIAGHAGKMPRPPRIEVPGGFFHVRVRGVNGERIFLWARDRLVFLQIVETLVGRCDWTCFAYCLMDNHFHLVIRTNQPTLGEGMHILNGRWARFVNDEYARDGHLFGQRYRSKAIEDDAQLLETSRYVVLNPVRAGLCATEEDSPWTSYRRTAGLVSRSPFVASGELLGMFSPDRAEAREAYRRFVREGRLRPRPLEPGPVPGTGPGRFGHG